MPENDVFPLEPDYSVVTRWSDGVARAVAESGRSFERLKRAPQRLFELDFRARRTSELTQLRAWWRRFERDFFIFEHKAHSLDSEQTALRSRCFAVTFAGPPEHDLAGHEAHDIHLRLVEAVGRPLNSYPDPEAGHESVFLEESAGAVLAGTWTQATQAAAHGGAERTNTNLNTTDAFQWVYAGYGFRVWARRAPNLGIMEILLDGVSVGTADLYAAAAQAAQPVFTKLDVPLGLHTVKLRATHTANPNNSSSEGTILADALEILI
ncbi:MAG TPA: hypothetical protein VNN18_06740 [Candidatus Xenobia bacterium]|nr:hypothetical protein [Candidatus Xenobia bacterium]